MSDIDLKRDFVAGLYSSNRWKKRVAGMPDGQVLAIYMREQSKAKEGTKSSEPEPKKKESGDDGLPF